MAGLPLEYSRSKADFAMFWEGACPVCTRPLHNHGFKEYNACKAAWLGLDTSAAYEDPVNPKLE